MALSLSARSTHIATSSARRISSRPRVVVARAAMADDFSAANKIGFTLDASANGCSGMYWRSKPDMNASVSAPDWPKNGAKLQGWKSVAHSGWVKVDHPEGYWLPIQQHGKDVVHFK